MKYINKNELKSMKAVVENEYPYKSDLSVTYMAIKRILRAKYPNMSRKERYSIRKECIAQYQEEQYIEFLLSNEIDNRFKFMLETEDAEKFGLNDMIKVFERCENPNLGIVQTLAKLMVITSTHNVDYEPIKFNLEKVEFIYCLLSDIIGRDNMSEELIKKGETARSLLWG